MLIATKIMHSLRTSSRRGGRRLAPSRAIAAVVALVVTVLLVFVSESGLPAAIAFSSPFRTGTCPSRRTGRRTTTVERPVVSSSALSVSLTPPRSSSSTTKFTDPSRLVPKNNDRDGDSIDASLDEGNDDDSEFIDLYSAFDDAADPTSLKDWLHGEADDAVSSAGFVRDEADILEEREDRFYTNQVQLERCLLVGVEDLSHRRHRRKLSKQLRDNVASYLALDTPRPSHDNGEDDDDDDVEYWFSLEESLSEMRELIRTAGMEIAGELTQRLPEINPRTYINSGKVEEAKELLKELQGCCTIVFDAELTPGQQKTLENAFNEKLIQDDFRAAGGEIKVIDRTALILDIFAQHARTREGKLQVDLALHEYRKPRLTKMWTHLERQSGAGGASGSVGLRGPGESQLQIDKRLVRDRIITLKRRLAAVQEQRAVRRHGRDRLGLPVLALVGYTNSGKSTCLNYLTKAGVMAESMLFATLDPTTRKVKLPGLKTHPEVLLTDTVGFIQKLPTQLIAAFRATLEEVSEADVLVHVIDVSNPSWRKQERAVRSVLSDIGASDKPVVRVLNKLDLLAPVDADDLRYEAAMSKHTVAISALYGDGVADLVACIEEAMTELLVPIEVLIPYTQGVELNAVHEQGNVELVDYREQGTYVKALVPEAIANRLEQYRLKKPRVTKTNPSESDDINWEALARGRH